MERAEQEIPKASFLRNLADKALLTNFLLLPEKGTAEFLFHAILRMAQELHSQKNSANLEAVCRVKNWTTSMTARIPLNFASETDFLKVPLLAPFSLSNSYLCKNDSCKEKLLGQQFQTVGPGLICGSRPGLGGLRN